MSDKYGEMFESYEVKLIYNKSFNKFTSFIVTFNVFKAETEN